MADEEEVQEVVEEEAPEEAPEAPSKELEAKARDMGWRPKEEFRGDPDAWRDAQEYVRRGEEILPVVRSRLEKSEAKAAELANQLDRQNKEWGDKFKRLEHMSDVALTKQKESLESQFAARKVAAVEAGDVEAYKKADTEEREALRDLADKTKVPDVSRDDTQQIPPVWKEAIDTWIAENADWFRDPELNAVASAAHARLRTEKPGLSPTENLSEVRAYVAKRYPEKFGNGQDTAPRGSRVEGGSRASGSDEGRGMWSKLPADAKAQADKFIEKDGLFLKRGEDKEKDKQKARERYAKEYFA